MSALISIKSITNDQNPVKDMFDSIQTVIYTKEEVNPNDETNISLKKMSGLQSTVG